jgi:NAD(P)-dependent dehydrogenase (short-subunit alcohol dehydrogenase family)
MSERRSAVITGGATGIGFATAVILNGEGFDLTIVARRGDVLASAAEAIAVQGGGPPVAVQAADLYEPDAAVRVVDAHVARFGGIDALVAGAGSYEPVGILELTASAWDATMDVHLRGAVLSASAAARHMTRAGRGRIVLISSVNGFHSDPGSIHYNAAKTAIISVARSLAVDLADTGVSANAVAPGWVTTPMTADYLADATPDRLRRVNPLGRAGRPDEIARVIRFLIVDAPEFLTGSTITVDGGQTAMAPMP